MKILIAIDQEACAAEAIKFVSEHNWPKEVEFKLIHVVPPALLDSPMQAYFLAELTEDARKAGLALLNKTATELAQQVKAATTVEAVIGFPAQVVIEEARTWSADLILVGTHGRLGFNRFIFGSVSYDIAAHAPCTVIALRFTPLKAKEEELVTVKGSAMLAAT